MTDKTYKFGTWYPIDEAPTGEPAWELSYYEGSEPFLAREHSGVVVQVRRIGGCNTYDFAGYDTYSTNYMEKCFSDWTPLPDPPEPPKDGK